MRWQELFADLEAQARSAESAETAAEVAELTRAEVGRVTLDARLHRAVGSEVRLQVAGTGELAGRLSRIGADWLLVTVPDEVVVVTAAVTTWWNLSAGATAESGIGLLVSRLRVTSALRAIARDRSPVVVTRRDGGSVVGTPDRVGADWVDLAVHGRGQAPRRGDVRARATLPLGQIATVSRGASGWDHG